MLWLNFLDILKKCVWLSSTISGRQCRTKDGTGDKTNDTICIKTVHYSLPVIFFLSQPLSLIHHLIGHVRPSVSFYWRTRSERGQLWAFSGLATAAKHAWHCICSVCSGSIRQLALQFTVAFSLGLTLLTGEQMDIIWWRVRPENGLASIFLSPVGSLK